MNDSRRPLDSGATLRGGDFSIGSPLGMGGFGITYRARDHRLMREVAVKEFFPQGCLRLGSKLEPSSGWTADGLKAQRDRFLEEGRTLARLRHPGIPVIFDIFEENETAYLVMEFVEGQTFAQYLADSKLWFLPPDEALALIQGAGEALAVMHGAQLLHRDLKPANIMRRFDGQVMLIDFGASRDFLPEAVHTLTVIFTAGYAPLEQYTRSGNHGPFTDVYSLAATLYHLLTGQKPLEAPRRATGEVLPSPHEVNPVIPVALSNAVMHGLEIGPGQRPASVELFLYELKASQVAGTDDSTNATVAVTAGTAGTLPPPISIPPASQPKPSSPIRPLDPPLPNVSSFAVPTPVPRKDSKRGQSGPGRIERWRDSLHATTMAGFKILTWSVVGWSAGWILGAILATQLPFDSYSYRQSEAAQYFQMDVALLLAMALGRWSYLKQKKLRWQRLGLTPALDPTKFNQVVLSTVWGAVASSAWLAVLGGQYLVVANGRHGYPDIRDNFLVIMVLWPIAWVWFFTNRFYKKNRAVGVKPHSTS